MTWTPHWKIQRDPYYLSLFESIIRKGFSGPEAEAILVEGGFIFDSDTIDRDVRKSVDILCTPLSKTLKNLAEYDRLIKDDIDARDQSLTRIGDNIAPQRRNRLYPNGPCILLTCGSFCPVHEGHMLIMGQGRTALEKAGYYPISGYVSPSHDEYITAKTGPAAIPIHYRIREIHNVTKKSDWLSVDPWEGIFNKVAINFTDVVMRLEEYVKLHTGGRDIPVFFVCGADNAKFALAFQEVGHCVVIGRPGYEKQFESYKTRIGGGQNSRRIFWSEGGNTLSSTGVRKERKFKRDASMNLILRVEEVSDLERPVIAMLKTKFEHIDEKLFSDQCKQFKDLQHLDLITMDSLLTHWQPPLRGKIPSLEISRNYDIFGQDLIGYTNRPGSEDLETQAKNIKPGSYYLFDDDIHTGGTMKYAKTLLKNNPEVKVKGIMAFSISSEDEGEILDSRDFIVNENENSGLVITLPNGTSARAPYFYPFVDIFVRGSVQDPMDFSIKMWQMNAKFFADCRPTDTLERYLNWIHLFTYVGFKAETKMLDICLHYANLLTEYIG